MLGRATSSDRVFPATLLFEEGWMLRLVLDWFAENRSVDHPLAFDASARWFSEAILPSTFLRRCRGDPHGEGYTHADGAIGHFQFGSTSQAKLSLNADSTMLKVTEAKMFSALSHRTTRAPGYNQAARNVACLAETIRLAGLDPAAMTDIGFFVLAPEKQIERGVFQGAMNKQSIESVVRHRVETYDGPKMDWFETSFLPVLRRAQVDCLSWESLVDLVDEHDPGFGADLSVYYQSCLRYNQQAKSAG